MKLGPVANNVNTSVPQPGTNRLAPCYGDVLPLFVSMRECTRLHERNSSTFVSLWGIINHFAELSILIRIWNE